MKAWGVLADEALDKVELAGVYVDDGALRSGARCLRAAAEKLDLAARLRDHARIDAQKATA